VISVGALTPILVCFHKLEITPPSNFNLVRDGTRSNAYSRVADLLKLRSGGVRADGYALSPSALSAVWASVGLWLEQWISPPSVLPADGPPKAVRSPQNWPKPLLESWNRATVSGFRHHGRDSWKKFCAAARRPPHKHW
jgi:hypothetical protein